jgi:hypothetical protein
MGVEYHAYAHEAATKKQPADSQAATCDRDIPESPSADIRGQPPSAIVQQGSGSLSSLPRRETNQPGGITANVSLIERIA